MKGSIEFSGFLYTCDEVKSMYTNRRLFIFCMASPSAGKQWLCPQALLKKQNAWRYCFIEKEESRKAEQWRLKGKFFYRTGCSAISVESTVVVS